jgi:hypothetical protein|nr:MAG TPA: hypothetical protein [Caudoviricetes sp.]
MCMNGKISFKARMNLKCGMAKPTAQPPRNPKQPNTQFVLVVLMIILLIQNPNVTTYTDLINPDSECYTIYSSDQTNRD